MVDASAGAEGPSLLSGGGFDDLAPCGFAVTAPNGTLIAVNGEFCSIVGRGRESLLGQRLQDLLTVGGRIYYETHLAPILLVDGEVRAVAVDFVAADDTAVPVLLSSVLSRADDGSPALIRTAVFEASQRRAYERELLAAADRAREAAERERELARALQAALMPERPPAIEGLEVAAAYQAATGGTVVGGDFYDVYALDATTWVVLLGDVCGKGPEAASVAALSRYVLRGALVRSGEPGVALEVLDDVLLTRGDLRFCTLVILVLRQQEGGWQVQHATGGHALPLLVDVDGTVRDVGTPGSLVGAFDGAIFSRTTFDLLHGQSLVLVTDGVVDGRRGTEMFGEGRLLGALSGRSSTAAMVQGVIDAALDFQDGCPRDDIAVIALRAQGPQRAQPT